MSRLGARHELAAITASSVTTRRPARSDSLRALWVTNWRIGWPERLRGLHYWLGWEYSAMLRILDVAPGAMVVDIGSGAHGIWPVALAQRREVRVVATDLHPLIDEQRRRVRRAERAGIATGDSVPVVRCDARQLPFETGSVDAVTVGVHHRTHARRPRRPDCDGRDRPHPAPGRPGLDHGSLPRERFDGRA